MQIHNRPKCSFIHNNMQYIHNTTIYEKIKNNIPVSIEDIHKSVQVNTRIYVDDGDNICSLLNVRNATVSEFNYIPTYSSVFLTIHNET